MTNGSIVSRLTLLLSLLALFVSSAAVAAGWRAKRGIGSAPPGPDLHADFETVEGRVTGLERQVELLRAAVAVRAVASAKAVSPPAVGAAAVPSAELADLTQRLVRLEQLAASIQGSRGADRRLSPEAMAGATRMVLDRQAPVEERAMALTLLRPNNGRADGRTHEVVTAALELLQTPGIHPKLRAGMIRDLDKLKDPALKDPLVGILTRDPDGRTRREAVETLAVFYDDPQVRALVERLRDSDPEEEVRAQAVKQLGRWQARGQ